MRRVHFIGIGGIGISALARYFMSKGWKISGSDNSDSEIVRDLRKEGIKIFIGQNGKNIKSGIDLVVYTAAASKNNPELIKAGALGIKTISYAWAIGELTKKYRTIAISGSHGKSTTTSMLSLILIKAGLDPSVIVGTKLKEFGNSNFRSGKSNYLVIEADEWNKSFLNYWPKIIVLTNIDREHLDTYGNEAGIIKTFSEYTNHLPEDGILIANYRDKNSRKIALSSGKKVIFYNKNKLPVHALRVPGKHNQLNAEAAWQCAKSLGIKKSVADSALSSYKGAWRRLEELKANVYTDYAHHPTEIKATLAALREKYKNSKITCIFEPHSADRLTRLFEDFKKSFINADKIIILPAYRPEGRELAKKEKTGFDLYNAIKNNRKTFYCDNFEEIPEYIGKNKSQVLVFMSAGKLDGWVRKIYVS